MSTPDVETTPGPGAERSSSARATQWVARSGVGYCLALWLLSRAAVAIGAALFLGRYRRDRWQLLAYHWDSWWYVRLASQGYSSSLRPPVHGFHHRFSDWAFFPAYPLLARGVHTASGLPVSVSTLTVATVAGAVSVLVVYRLGEQYGGVVAARRAALLYACWPGSAVLLMSYSEGLFVTVTGLGLLALLRGQWWTAGVFGMAATATRATGVAFVAAALVCALTRTVGRRGNRALAAPLVASAGLGLFVAYGYARTGDLLVWRHAENLWYQRLDLCLGLARRWLHALPRGDHRALTELFGLMAIALLLGFALRRPRPHWRSPLVVYTAGALALMLAYSAVGPRPRMLLGAFPLFVLAAAKMPRPLVWALAVTWVALQGALAYLWLGTLTP